MEKKELAKMNDYVENILFLFNREQELLSSVDPLSPEEQISLEQVQKQLNQDCSEVREKADLYGAVWLKLERQAAVVKEEIDRLQYRKKSFESQLSNLKYRLFSAFEILKIEKLKTAFYSFGFRSSQTVEVQCPVERLPDCFKRVKTIVEADKIKLKDALKLGETIDGVELVDHKTITCK